jgi:hypothetical protein
VTSFVQVTKFQSFNAVWRQPGQVYVLPPTRPPPQPILQRRPLHSGGGAHCGGASRPKKHKRSRQKALNQLFNARLITETLPWSWLHMTCPWLFLELLDWGLHPFAYRWGPYGTPATGALYVSSFAKRFARTAACCFPRAWCVVHSFQWLQQLQQIRLHLHWHQDSLCHVETQGWVVGDSTVGLVAQGLVQGQGRGIVALHLEHQSWLW